MPVSHNTPHMRTIEMYIGDLDGTWYTTGVHVEAGLDDQTAEQMATEQMLRLISEEGLSIAFFGVYSMPLDEEED